MAIIIGGLGSRMVLQLILKNTLVAGGSNAKQISHTFYYLKTPANGTDDRVAFTAAFLAGSYAALLAAWNVGMSAGNANTRYIDDVLNATLTIPLAGVGAIATDRLPSYNAVYMLLQTGFRKSYNRGSKHFAGANEIDTTSDVLTGAGLARWQAVQAALIVPIVIGGNTYTPAVVAFKPPLSQVKINPTQVTVNPITSIVLNTDVGTMRKRKVLRTV